MIKAALFARVSTREQAEEGYSLPAQEKLLQDYSSKQNFTLTKRFSVPESARGKQERKLFNELLAYIDEHKEIKIVLCEKVDRITRNFKDAVRLDDWLNEDESRQIHFVKQSLVIHKNARSHEKFQWDIYLALARQYSNNLSEETKKGMDEKAEQGWYPGNHKRAYKTIGDSGHKIWFIDKENLDYQFITKAFELYDTGNFSLRTLVKELFKQGWTNGKGEPIAPAEIHILLSDPFYCGEFTWKEKLYKNGKHEPLVSNELFYRVQDRLKRPLKAGKYVKHTFVFGGGILICGECGRCVTGEPQKGHIYYHCTRHDRNDDNSKKCTQKKYIREEKIRDQILEILDTLIINKPKTQEWIRKALLEFHEDEIEFRTTTIAELEDRQKLTETMLDNLYRDKWNKKITEEFYDRNQKKYEAELNATLDAIATYRKAGADHKKLGINIFELSQKGHKIYEKKTTLEEKRELLHFVFLNLKLKDGKVVPSFHNGFEVIAAHAKSGNWLRS